MVGNVKLVGKLPVVNARGAEVVPSFTTSLMMYVVFGSRPATRKFVLSPGTMGSWVVSCHDGFGPDWLNWTYIEVPEQGGAL
jgi:hypothetical protein